MSSGSGTPNEVWSRRAPQQGPRPQNHRGNPNMSTQRGGMNQQPYNTRPNQNPWHKQGNAPQPSIPNQQVQSANKTNPPPSSSSPSIVANTAKPSTAAVPPPVNGFNRKEVNDFLNETHLEVQKAAPEGIVKVRIGSTQRNGVKPGTMASGLDFLTEVRKGVLAVNKAAAAGNTKEAAKK